MSGDVDTRIRFQLTAYFSGLTASVLTLVSVLELFKCIFSAASALKVFKSASAFSGSALNLFLAFFAFSATF